MKKSVKSYFTRTANRIKISRFIIESIQKHRHSVSCYLNCMRLIQSGINTAFCFYFYHLSISNQHINGRKKVSGFKTKNKEKLVTHSTGEHIYRSRLFCCMYLLMMIMLNNTQLKCMERQQSITIL